MSTASPVLIPLNEGQSVWMSLVLPVVINVAEGWEINRVDEKTLLPEATKNSQFEATFYWCDSNGRKVPDNLCSHVAVVVGGDTAIEACEREQNELVKLILELMECTPEELAISPGNCDQ